MTIAEATAPTIATAQPPSLDDLMERLGGIALLACPG